MVASLKHRVISGFLRSPYLMLRSWRWSFWLLRECLYDFNRVRRYSSAVHFGDGAEKLKVLLTMAYHSLEKGMSLRNPRPGFGQQHARTLVARLDRYLTCCGVDEHCAVSFNVLRAYAEFNRAKGVSLPWLDRHLEEFEKRIADACAGLHPGGVKPMTKNQFLTAAKRDLTGFFESRCSVRQYSPEPVTVQDIERAVRLAQKTPSVCNRQSARVWLLNQPQDVRDALSIQGGARGFAEEIGTVLVVTSDLAAFQSSGERNQCWIDGGLFAMSLIYALHSLGLVSCSLNWSKSRQTDLQFKERFGVPHAESIILLLSVGNPAESFSVAQSWRKPLSEVLRTISHK